jgi:hypothetical protein
VALHAGVLLRGDKPEQVESFHYLRTTITWDSRITTDIKCRIAHGEDTFMRKQQLQSSKTTGLKTRKQYETTLYISEISAIEKADLGNK